MSAELFADERVDEQQVLNLQHADSPEVGDYWHEMFVPVAIVLKVTGSDVTFGYKTLPSGPSHWTWDVSATQRVSRAEFRRRLEYKTIPNKFWCQRQMDG